MLGGNIWFKANTGIIDKESFVAFAKIDRFGFAVCNHLRGFIQIQWKTKRKDKIVGGA